MEMATNYTTVEQLHTKQHTITTNNHQSPQLIAHVGSWDCCWPLATSKLIAITPQHPSFYNAVWNYSMHATGDSYAIISTSTFNLCKASQQYSNIMLPKSHLSTIITTTIIIMYIVQGQYCNQRLLKLRTDGGYARVRELGSVHWFCIVTDDRCLELEMGIEPNPNRTNQTRTLIFERTEQN